MIEPLAPSELEQELRRDFPVLYHVPIECGAYLPKGWTALIRDLSEELEPMFAEYDKKTRPVVLQLKVKWGSFVMYCSNDTTQEMHNAIARAEERADHTCMNCGASESGRVERGTHSVMCGVCRHA